MKKISVIIPSYNSWPEIEKTLSALNAQTKPELMEEVLVVDSSDDGKTKEFLLGYRMNNLRVIDAGTKLFPGLGRNLGASQAKGRILAFVDADAYPENTWLENIDQAYTQGCRVGGGAILVPEFQRNRCIVLAQYYLQFNEYMDSGARRAKRFVPSCNMFCDKELFERAGGFPEIRAAEDVLFGINTGKIEKIWFDPKIEVYHVFRTRLTKFLSNQMLLGEYIIKYRRMQMSGKFYYRKYWPLIFLPAFFLIKLAGITVRILRSKPKAALRYFMVLPLVLTGLTAWSAGFVNGVLDFKQKG